MTSLSLPLLNEITKGTTKSITGGCAPAVLVLLIGSALITWNIFNGHMHVIGTYLLGTFVFTILTGFLCLTGFTSVGWVMLATPLIVVMSLVLIVVLTLMLTSPHRRHVHPRGHGHGHGHSHGHSGDHPSMSESYRYVMTGRG